LRRIASTALVAFILLVAATTMGIAEVDCEHLPPDYTEADVKAPMRFFMADHHGCFGHAVNEPYMAVGVITPNTPAAFSEFIKNNRPDAPLEFTSPGGNLLSALKLGAMIRQANFDTSLGKLCASACAYALLGGVHRYVLADKNFDPDADYDNRNVGATGTKFGVHQFYSHEAFTDPQEKAFSAIDTSANQVIVGLLLEYTLRMGVDTRLVSAASGVPPWEEMRWITPDEMLAWNVDNTHRRYSPVELHALGRSGAYAEIGNRRGSDESFLRVSCKAGVKEPLFTFVFDLPTAAPETQAAAIARITAYVQSVFSRLVLSIAIGAETISTRFSLYELKAVSGGHDTVRTFAVVRPTETSRDRLPSLDRVALTDAGELARSDWSIQDALKFKITGDRRLIALALRNCTN
jgi:hypothetical protein